LRPLRLKDIHCSLKYFFIFATLNYLQILKHKEMNSLSNSPPLTPESSWAEINEFVRQVAKTQAENERILNEKFAETDRLFKETREEMKETDRRMQETDRQMQETDRRIRETEKIVKETSLQMKETDRRMKELQKELGGIGRSNGDFAEEYFFNAFERSQKNFFGEAFDEITKNIRFDGKTLGRIAAEYDIVLLNGKSVGIIETKYKAHREQIQEVIQKAETFRLNLPKYQHYQIYLGLAALTFEERTEADCISKGIAIIKQLGDSVVINDAHLKVF
jgi:hypothetical protein